MEFMSVMLTLGLTCETAKQCAESADETLRFCQVETVVIQCVHSTSSALVNYPHAAFAKVFKDLHELSDHNKFLHISLLLIQNLNQIPIFLRQP